MRREGAELGTNRSTRHAIRVLETSDDDRMPDEAVLGELVAFMDERIIPRLPVSSCWSWALRRVRAELLAAASPPDAYGP